ncbi:protein FAM210A [Brevipalpus obovatus]|uniref:protein FAM210A n=1 Tax=Brevipalpus obovatus TaxID=246614 RepID=UPI003D9EB6D6
MQALRLYSLVAFNNSKLASKIITNFHHRCVPLLSSRFNPTTTHLFCTKNGNRPSPPLQPQHSSSEKPLMTDFSSKLATDSGVKIEKTEIKDAEQERMEEARRQWQEYEEELKNLGLVKRYYKLFKDYWFLGLPVAAAVSLFFFGSLYFIASLGGIASIVGPLRSFGFPESILEKLEKSEKLGAIAITLILYKIVSPLRYFLVVYLMIFSAKHLVRRGLIKPFPSKKDLQQMIKNKVNQVKEKGA